MTTVRAAALVAGMVLLMVGCGPTTPDAGPRSGADDRPPSPLSEASATARASGDDRDAPGLRDGGPYALPHTEVRRLRRTSDGVEHVLYVNLPRGHGIPGQRYPTVYLLDPDYSFAIASNVVEHFVDRGNLVPMILVGVGYPGQSQDRDVYRRHRSRDYTPTFHPSDGYGPEFQRHSGGGPAFRDVLVDELIPFVEREYPAGAPRTLVGHSYGGLFATFVLLTRPEAFQRYLVVSPSYWYDDGVIFRFEEEAAARFDDLPARVALTVGEHENQPHNGRPMVDDLHRLAEMLRSRGYPGFELETQVFDDETHNSVFPAAFTRSIRWLARDG
jgi:predicted alpha/beta superfamily hydrolase